MSLDDDPTDFEGVIPLIPPDSLPPARKDPRSNAATGATAAGVRAFTAQSIAFYFRAPVKSFFRTRVDYLAYAKAINPRVQAGEYGWRTTMPGLLAFAIDKHGWRFIPDQVLPPLLANVAVGAVLYTSYLQILARLHEPSAHSTKRVIPPPPMTDTLRAGFLAGSIQSVVAAPLDALQVRFDAREARHEHKTMWQYGRGKLREIGLRGIFAGWSLSFLKDSFGSAVFFATFEYVKAQSYYKFVRYFYGALKPQDVNLLAQRKGTSEKGSFDQPLIRPHYAIEPAFLTLAGMAATVTQQCIIYPLGLIQELHYERLEELDRQAKNLQLTSRRGRMLQEYYRAYAQTWKQCKRQAVEAGGLRKWLFRGFWWNTARQVPSTSAGLIIFELVRRKYGIGESEAKIEEDGYSILLR